MSKYDHLDASSGLEQSITADLKTALEKRGCTITHRGSDTRHAAGGGADIIVSHANFVLIIEATKARNTAQDREMLAIKAHLNATKQENLQKDCFCIYTAPTTPPRMREAIRDYNRQIAADGNRDLKILPLCFETLELLLTRWTENEAALYPVNKFKSIFEHHTDFVDDLRIEKLVVHTMFPLETGLSDDIEAREREIDNKTLEQLIKDLLNLEDVMRQNGIATGQETIANLIFLVFLKVYEEKEEKKGRVNHLRSVEAFLSYRDTLEEDVQEKKRAIHSLFSTIKNNREFTTSRMFTPNDNLTDSLTDDFIINNFIPKLAPYTFEGTRVDALGAVYEVLAQRAGKDVKAGQFFTPENVVRFMVSLANLRFDDRVLDPACGTGRFLVYAMHDMLEKLRRIENVRNRSETEKKIRKEQLFGSDIDERIGKIAKMNMWIHGDGKSNIFGGLKYSGLTLNTVDSTDLPSHLPSFDNAFDVILANPPLGDLNYQAINFSPIPGMSKEEVALERIPILPHKNTLAVKAEELRKRIEKYQMELADLTAQNATAKRIASKQKTIDDNLASLTELRNQLDRGSANYEITGNTLKGGALFLTAMWHYLKSETDSEALPEWRGGRLLVILDEGVLNTDDYRETREYLREKFYIKAVISLTRDTFVPISKTATKTSIFYAVKKTDIHAVQKEPIFFGHVARTGLDTKGKATHNDFTDVLNSYESFTHAVRNAYVGLEFRRERFVWDTGAI